MKQCSRTSTFIFSPFVRFGSGLDLQLINGLGIEYRSKVGTFLHPATTMYVLELTNCHNCEDCVVDGGVCAVD